MQAHPEHQKAAVLKDTKISTRLLRAADGGGGDDDGNHDNYGNGSTQNISFQTLLIDGTSCGAFENTDSWSPSHIY